MSASSSPAAVRSVSGGGGGACGSEGSAHAAASPARRQETSSCPTAAASCAARNAQSSSSSEGSAPTTRLAEICLLSRAHVSTSPRPRMSSVFVRWSMPLATSAPKNSHAAARRSASSATRLARAAFATESPGLWPKPPSTKRPTSIQSTYRRAVAVAATATLVSGNAISAFHASVKRRSASVSTRIASFTRAAAAAARASPDAPATISSSTASITRQNASAAERAWFWFAPVSRSKKSCVNRGQRVGNCARATSATVCASLFFTNGGTGGSARATASATQLMSVLCRNDASSSESVCKTFAPEPPTERSGANASVSVCRHQNRTSG